MTPMGFPGIMKPPKKGEMTLSERRMLVIPIIIQQGMTKTRARRRETKYVHQGS